MRQFPLPPRHEELLNKTFGHDQWREDKKLAGFSGASVYQIIFRNNPVVVKIAPPAVIQREQTGYHDFVLDNLHHHAPKLGGYYESTDQQEAILRYTYAGSVARSQTLFEFLERPSPKAVQEVCATLGKMFTLNQSDHPKSWWERAERKNIRSAEYYDRWLPVQLVLEQIPAAIEGVTLLQAQRLSWTDIATLTAGDFVLLQDFQVEKQENGVATLYAGRPQAPSLRVKVRGIQNEYDGVFPALYAVVKETRAMLLETYAEDAVGAFAMHAPRFTVEGHEYHNPFYYLDELLNTRYEAYLATIHGDFNLRNILLEEKSQSSTNFIVRPLTNLFGQKSYDWWLIDFASAQTGPVLLDLQWLEAQVINWLLVPALQRTGQGPQALVQILEGLQRRRALYFQLRTIELRAVYTLLQEIRRLAESYLAEPAHNPDRWQEYYRGLTLALAATLKQEALSNELGQQAKKFALIAAATTVRWAGVKLVTPVQQGWQPLSGRLLAGVVVGLLAIVGIYGARQTLWPTAPTPTTTPVNPTVTLVTLTPTLAAATPPPTSAPAVIVVPPEPASILARVEERGHLLCGVNGDLPLFGWDPVTPKHRSWKPEAPADIDTYDNAEGFDADFCRVVATAIFGDYVDRVKFVNVGPKERFQALTQNVIDLLSRNTTWTPDRDSGLGVDFTAITFYTKQKLLVKKDTFQQWEELAGQRICVLPATTTLANLESLRLKMGWIAVTQDREGNFTSNQQVFDAFKAGYCDAFTSDGDQLIAFTSQPKSGEERLYFSPAEYEILEIIDEAIPDEPRALVVAANDSHWRKVVSYAVWATIYAEELGITQENVASYAQLPDLRFKEFLGAADELIPPGGQIGELLQVQPTFAYNIIARLGNYGEIYARHLETYIPDRSANQSWKLDRAGRLFTPPFVLAQLTTPTPAPTVEQPATPFPVVIGVAVDLQDKESLLGDNQSKAAKVAATLLQSTMPDFELTLVVENTNSSPEDAQLAMERLMAKGVLFIVGPTLSSQAQIVDPLVDAQKIPIIGPSNTAKGIAQLGCYVSRISPPVTQIGPFALAQAYQEQPTTRSVAVAYLQGNAFTEDEAQVFIEEATRTDLTRKWQLVHTETYTNTEIDFAPHAIKLIEAKPDLIMIAGLTKDGGLLVKELREKQYQGLIVGGNGFNTSGIFKVCEGACNGIILAQAYDNRREQATAAHERFIRAYEQAYQSYPSPIAAQMFTAIQVGIEALQRIHARTQGGVVTLTLPALRDELNKELLTGAQFQDTPLGEISFAANGEVLQAQFYGAQIVIDANGENGRFETLSEYPNEAITTLAAAPSDCPAGYLAP